MKHKQKKNQICKPMPNMQPITREKTSYATSRVKENKATKKY